MKLRRYQQECVEAVEKAWYEQSVERPAVVMATGLGKTVVFAHLIERAIRVSGVGRVLVLVHRDELAVQTAGKVHAVAPSLTIGTVKAGQNEVDAQVIIGSIQTLAKESRREDIRGIGMIVVDEAHHAAALTWRAVLRHFGAYDGVPTVGFSATLSRDGDLGLGEVWTDVVFERDLIWGIRNGWLVDLIGRRIQVPRLDLAGIRVSSGDGIDNRLGTAMMNADAPTAIVKAVLEHAADRQGIIFAPNVETAHAFGDALSDAGIRTETVTGATPRHVRQAMYARAESGHTRWLSNAMVLTEGFDGPWFSAGVLARRTTSRTLYQQMVGRLTRLWKPGGKVNSLVLDVVGAAENGTLASIVDLGLDAEKPDTTLTQSWDELEDELYADDDHAPETELLLTGHTVDRVVTTDIDLFGDSPSVWLRTYGGVWFISAGLGIVIFLWPEPDGELYTIGRLSTTGRGPAQPVMTGVDRELGMSIAEDVAADIDPSSSYSGKAARWRDHALAGPTEMAQAKRAGLDLPPGTKLSVAADLIAVAQASRRLDTP